MRRPAPTEPAIMIGDYRRLNDIGKGSFAMVFRGVHAVRFVAPPALSTIYVIHKLIHVPL